MRSIPRSYWFGAGLIAATAIMAACGSGNGSVSGGGGTGITPNITIAPVTRAHVAQAMSAAEKRKHPKKGELRIKIKIPPKYLHLPPGYSVSLPVGGSNQRHTIRKPKYVSPSTQSMTVATSAGGPAQTFNLTANSSHCSVDSTTGYLTCTESAFFAVGAQTIAITLYDGQNGTGSALSSGSTSTTIVAGQVNTISVTLDGIVATATVQIDNASSVNIPEGTPTSLPVEVSAYDADHNLILVPGHYASTTPVTLSDSDSSGVTTLSSSSVSAPGSSITLSYNGGSLSSATITVKVSGMTQANPATLTASPSSSPSPAPGLLYVAEGNQQSNSQVQVYQESNLSAGPIETITNGINTPAQIAVDSHGNLYVANYGANDVTMYPQGSTSPSVTYTLRASGSDLSHPCTVAVGTDGTVYVGEYVNYDVVEFPPGSTTPSQIVANPNPGAPSGGISGLFSIALDNANNLYYYGFYYAYRGTDYTDEVWRFAQGASTGEGTNLNIAFPNSPGGPGGIVTDSQGNLLTAFQQYGAPAGIDFYSAGSTTAYQEITSVSQPNQIAIGGSRLLYVADGGNGEVEVYSLSGSAPTLVNQITGLTAPDGVATSDGQLGQPWLMMRRRKLIQ